MSEKEAKLRKEAEVTVEEKNRFLVLKTLIGGKDTTLAAIAQAAKLSQKVVTPILAKLAKEQVISEEGKVYKINAKHPRYADLKNELAKDLSVTPNPDGTFNIRSLK